MGDDLVTDIGGGHEVGAAVVLARSGKGDRLQPGAEAEPYVHHLQPPSTACPAPNLAIDSLWAEMDGVAP